MEHMNQYEELYRAWIGEKNQNEYFEKMHKGGFNWVAFFLSDLLLLTRKMFTESIVLILLVYLINTVLGIIGVPDIVYSVISLALCLTLGFTYYYLYRWHIKRKIEKYQKKGLSYEEQLQMARKCGGDKITVGVIVMFIVEIVLVAFLTLGMNAILNVIYNANNPVNYYNSTEYENNYSDFDYDSSNSYLNDDYYSNTDNFNDNSTDEKSWNLDSFSLSYNANNWKEMTQDGYKVLKYKNTQNYLAYVGSGNNDVGLTTIKSESFQDNFEQKVQQQIQSSNQNITYLYSDWEDVDDRLYLCTVDCSVTDPNTGAYGYITYYYYFSNSKMYCLMTTEVQSDYSFTFEAMEVINTIKNNSQI